MNTIRARSRCSKHAYAPRIPEASSSAAACAVFAFVSPAHASASAANTYDVASRPSVAGDDPVNGSDPSGLCNLPHSQIYLVPGPCEWSNIKWEQQVQGYLAIQKTFSSGPSFGDFLESQANFWAGAANSVVSGVTFGHVHVPKPFCNYSDEYTAGGIYGQVAPFALGVGEAEAPAEAESALSQASSAAQDAADNSGDWSVSAKHLAESGGNWSKFAAGTDPAALAAEALRSDGALFLPNTAGAADSFVVEADLGRVIGTQGQPGSKSLFQMMVESSRPTQSSDDLHVLERSHGATRDSKPIRPSAWCGRDLRDSGW